MDMEAGHDIFRVVLCLLDDRFAPEVSSLLQEIEDFLSNLLLLVCVKIDCSVHDEFGVDVHSNVDRKVDVPVFLKPHIENRTKDPNDGIGVLCAEHLDPALRLVSSPAPLDDVS